MSDSEELIQEVWGKGKVVTDYNKNIWRKDECGAWIGREYYGNRNSIYGWEIDHIISTDHGGEDILSNYRPLQWVNNTKKGSGRLKCVVISDGNKNIYIE